jgi:hypothetical protein
MQEKGDGMPEDQTGGVGKGVVAPEAHESIEDPASIYAEAKRLLDFKAQHLKGEDHTLCPQCGKSVDLDVYVCIHCGADISDHLAQIKEELRRLDTVAEELYHRYEETLRRHRQEIADRPLWQRFRMLLADRRLWRDLEVVGPPFLVFFAFVITIRVMGHGALFWAVAGVGGFIAYFLLLKSKIRRRITLDFYQMSLVIGLALVISSAIYRPMEMWPRLSSAWVEVTKPLANIREGATTESPVVLEVHQGVKLIVLERDGAWYRVRTDTEETGWVHASLVSDIE